MQILLHAAAWMINILFWAGFIPQIILNHRLKTSRGVSDLMLLAFFNGYITYIYYVFCCDLPMAYKALTPLCLFTVIIMLVQRFMYDTYPKKLLLLYFVNGIASLVFLPYSFAKTALIGDVMGWISAMIWFVLSTPQIIKIFREKSVVGFSFLFVTFVGFGDMIQSILAIILQLPAQTLCNGLRGTLVYLIFCLQFLLYRKKREIRYHGAVADYSFPIKDQEEESEQSA